MNTAEMWLVAQTSGYTYECPEHKMLYSKKAGLVERDGCFNSDIYVGDLPSFATLDELMHYEWKVADNVMTIKEAEEKYGIQIIRNNA